MFLIRLLPVAFLLSLALVFSAANSPLAATSSRAPSRALRVSGSGTALPLVQKLAEAYRLKHDDARFIFEVGTDSGGAIRGVITSTLDLAVANRPLTVAETEEGLEYHPFARDAIVFAIHLPNPVKSLSTVQVRDIFGGNLTNWRQLGGPAGPILVLDRDEDESARKLVLVPLLQKRPIKARTIVLTSARDMVLSLNSTPNSLGYTSLGLLRILQPQNVRVLALDGIMPSRDSLVQGVYPWHLTFGLIHRRDLSPTGRQFIDFVLGPEGQRVLEEYGYAAVQQ